MDCIFNIWSCRFFQEFQLTNDPSIFPFMSHLLSCYVCVLDFTGHLRSILDLCFQGFQIIGISDMADKFLWYHPFAFISSPLDTHQPVLHPCSQILSQTLLLLSATPTLPLLPVCSRLCTPPVGCVSCNTGMDPP